MDPFDQREMGAVSYTHLDVYKRQQQHYIAIKLFFCVFETIIN